jgi:cytochrome c556
MKKTLQMILISTIGIFITISASAQDNAALLKYRQNLMKANGMAMGMIGSILKDKLSFTEQVASHALTVKMNMLLMEKAYAKKVTSGKTDSKPEVWAMWPKFKQAAANSAQAADALAVAAATGDPTMIFPKLKAVGQTCGACHQTFRQPKGKRFIR